MKLQLFIYTFAVLFVAVKSDSLNEKCNLETRKVYQPKEPDVTCQRVMGKLYNSSVLHMPSDFNKLKRFSEIAANLLQIAASSCDPKLERCVSQVLAYGCGVQYFVCLLSPNKESYISTQLCKSFCDETQQCISRYPQIEQQVLSIVSQLEMNSVTQQRCLQGSGPDALGTYHTYCRFNDNEDLDKLLDPTRLYEKWDIQQCCSSGKHSENSLSKCCNQENFVQLPAAKNCVLKCPNNALYSETDRILAFNWILICASICALSSAITVLTYFADVNRFAYPEKPIICHSVCCFFYACGHFFRLVSGVEGVACTDSRSGRVYLQEGLNGEFMCTVSFLLIYYSQIALHVWWVVLAISWFLTAVKGWSQEALEAISIWFHVSAWAIPTVQTVVTLATKRFEGDPLTGLCVIGSQTSINLLFFVIIPISFCALLGLMLITYGFVSVFQVRKRLRTTKIDANLSTVDTKRFDKLMIRMSVFTISYTVPTAVYLALTVYEYMQVPKWYETINTISYPFSTDDDSERTLPKVHLSLIKIFTPFVLCIGTCFWILNCKTLKLWTRVLFRCCRTPYEYNKAPVSVHFTPNSNPNLLVPATQFRPQNGNNSSPVLQNKSNKKPGQSQALMGGAYLNGANPTAATHYDMGKV